MIEITLPAMGEGIIEAEITRWLVREGMQVQMDQALVEVATDKVDSEIPSPAGGTIHKIMLKEGDTAKVGQVMALIAVPGEDGDSASPAGAEPETAAEQEDAGERETGKDLRAKTEVPRIRRSGPDAEQVPALSAGMYEKVAFLSPVIRKLIAENEISPQELQGLEGSGIRGRITKADVLAYLALRQPSLRDGHSVANSKPGVTRKSDHSDSEPPAGRPPLLSREQIYGSTPSTTEEMDRRRKLIADHMVYSKQVSPHVTSFVESDVTEMIRWRNRVQDEFGRKYHQKLTITTLILEAVIQALKEYPGINVSVDGYTIIRKQEINLGMAAALPDGNLIVPVIHHADRLNLGGLAAKVNDLADRARDHKLQPHEIQGGTFTVTNMGQFGNIAGTPIINQPQVAILAVGAIVKKPSVVQTPDGDAIGIRHMLILSLAYDHRIVDGALGGSFLKSIGDHLQGFDPGRGI